MRRREPTPRADAVRELVIRCAQPDEYDEIAHVWMESGLSTGLFDRLPYGWDELRQRVARVAMDENLFIAGDDEVAGFVAFRRRDNYLHLLFVAPDRQGRGVGRALLDFAKAQLGRDVWLRAARDYRRVWQWYEREGFVFEKEAPHEISGMALRYYRWTRS